MPAKVDGLCAEIMTAVRSFSKDIQQDKKKIAALEEQVKVANDRADALAKKWKKAVLKAGEVQTRWNVTAELCDSDLIIRVSQLRRQVMSFSARYFIGEPSAQRKDFQIQSFLWDVLIRAVFGKYSWAPWLREPIRKHGEATKQVMSAYANPDVSAAEQEFQIWKSATLAFAFRWINDKEMGSQVDSFISSLSTKILGDIVLIAMTSTEEILDDIRDILYKAIILDQEMCKLPARFDWIYPTQQPQLQFSPETMKLEPAQPTPPPDPVVDIITAPGLTKRGNHSGGKSNVEIRLLKIMVVCAQCEQ
ncbi:hypothetical protein F5Y16DRAFT_406089 [Xylariaceae sp. FL0255]|nr:hypothetical protein F5Y16DRAFT_406089 [Xylariaceae sp. FL0255]